MNPKVIFAILLSSSVAFAADYELQILEKAHGMFRSATNSTMYADAAQQYEFLVEEEGVRNGRLFYTLGNAYFLAGDIGRAVLNYRRAEQYLPNNPDVQHNLATALEQRTDLIPAKEPHPVAARVLGWHFSTSTAFRWWLFAACWLVTWSAWFWKRKTEKKGARVTMIFSGVLSIVLIVSLATESVLEQIAEPGVVVAKEVLARKGDGEMYAPAFLDPLHSGTEFQRLEDRGHWWHIRLTDGQECWIPARTARMVSF